MYFTRFSYLSQKSWTSTSQSVKSETILFFFKPTAKNQFTSLKNCQKKKKGQATSTNGYINLAV